MPKDGIYISQHKIIKEFVDANPLGISVKAIASELSLDPSTVREHLVVMAIDGYGLFTDDSQRMFVGRKGISELYNKLKQHELTGGYF